MLDDECRLAQRVDQLRAPERLHGDGLCRGEGRVRSVKTRAGLFRAVGEPLEVVELDLAEPGPDDVVVRIVAAGICGTDLHQVKGEWQRPTPMVLGHEGAGIVEHVGDAVDSVRVGDEVVLSWAPSCGTCADCARARPAACVPLHRAIGNGTLVDGTTGMSLDGATVYRGTATGAWAEHVVVSSQVALPTHGAVPLRDAALLGCAALTGVGAVLFAARATPGGVALVIGAGGVGQFVVQGARLAGAEAIVVVDPVEARREQVLRLGATHAVHPDDLKETMAWVSPEGADYGFDAVGYPETTVTALRFTRSGGTTVMVGLPPTGLRLDLDPGEFLRREKFLTGTMYGSEDPAVALPILLEHVAAGRLELAPLLGEVFSLDAIDDAVQASLELPAGRVLIEP
ncbi:MAG: alcohol dehydrogenase [Thermoleophilia bacterium]|nr:alcohol dehydrogenase [Thermoleophilia bacterium]